MTDRLLPALLMVCGLAPGVVALVAALRLLRAGRPADDPPFTTWVGAGYVYVAIFVLAGVTLALGSETGAWVAGPLWVGLPAFVSLLGLKTVAAEHAALRAQVTTLDGLERAADHLRLESQRLSAALAQDLSHLMGAQSRLAARGEMALRARQYGLLERLGGRVRKLLKQTHEHSAALASLLRGVRALTGDEPPTTEALGTARDEYERLRADLAPLRAEHAALHTEIDVQLARLKWLD